jgi:hypothetical protein
MTASQRLLPPALHVTLGRDGSLKMGTCAHCVIHEQGRPERAWDAQGDLELDFDRNALITQLARLGVVVDIQQEYVCP